MKKIDLYLIKEHLGPFVGGLFTFTILLLLNSIYQLMDLIIKKGVPVLIVLKVFLYSLPFILAMTVSMALLVSSLVAYGHLSQDFEIMAFKSLGISFKRTLKGPLFFAFFVFLFMCWFNDRILPESNHRLKNLLFSIHAKKPAARIEEGAFSKVGDYMIYTRKKNEKTGVLKDIKIIEKLPQKNGVRTIVAKKGFLRTVSDSMIVLVLWDGSIYESLGKKDEDFREIRFKKQVLNIEIDTKLAEKERTYRSEREMTMKMLLAAKKEKDKEIAKTDPRDTIRLRILKNIKNRYKIEIHKKISLPFAGIVFIVLGACIASITKKGGYGAAFGFSFIVFTVYYIFLIGGEELARRGYIPPFIAMWFANVFFGIISVYLSRRAE